MHICDYGVLVMVGDISIIHASINIQEQYALEKY